MEGRLKKLKTENEEYVFPITVSKAVYTDPTTNLYDKLEQIEQRIDEDASSHSTTYKIELERWGIKSDGTNSKQTTQGINNALSWAVEQGISHVILQNGQYLVEPDADTLTAIHMPSGLHLELSSGTVIQMASTSSPSYQIVRFQDVQGSKLSGGIIRGDKKTHTYELMLRFERGGVNADGSLNDDPNWIRSEIIDRYEHPGLLAHFRIWKPEIEGVTAQGYSFFQYKDYVASHALVGYRDNGKFALENPAGRGWFLSEQGVAANNKMIITMQIDGEAISDEEIEQMRVKLDNAYYTHETGVGVAISGSRHITIEQVEICDCTGDGVMTSWSTYHLDPSNYTQDEMGGNITIRNCHIHHCRRQGITLAGANDVYIEGNHIHHIGYADDGETIDGTAPMFGIDIESMASESNIPYKSVYLGTDGLELNYRIHIIRNYIHHNARGHFVNVDGSDVIIAQNTFEGYNVGGISSYQTQYDIQYLHNTFIGCKLWVKGDNIVFGGNFRDGASIQLHEVNGAVVSHCKIVNGLLFGTSAYGYFGTPEVNVEENRFSFPFAHGMGNSASVSFENWLGKVPSGIEVEKRYYVVNRTEQSFQVAESIGGTPIQITDAGEPGFHVARIQYGRCVLSDIVIEQEWLTENNEPPHVFLRMAGGVIHNLTVKNYNLTITPPDDYVGRPIVIEGLNQINGGANLEGCHIKNSVWMRMNSAITDGDIKLGNERTNSHTPVSVEQCEFINLTINCRNVTLNRSTFKGCHIIKNDHETYTSILQSYLEDSRLSTHWLQLSDGFTIAGCMLNRVNLQTNENTRLINNTVLE